MKVWDTDAVTEALKTRSRRFMEDFIAQKAIITGPTITELAVWREDDPEIEKFYEQLHSLASALIPKRRDFFRAGRWLQTMEVTGSPAERRQRRAKLVMDSLVAATAWGNGLPVVTKNVRDFAHLQAQAEDMLPGRITPEIIPYAEAVDGRLE